MGRKPKNKIQAIREEDDEDTSPGIYGKPPYREIRNVSFTTGTELKKWLRKYSGLPIREKKPESIIDPYAVVPTLEHRAYNQRYGRAHSAHQFGLAYEFVRGKKFCISSGIQYFAPTGKYCFDSSWVSVHGSYTICMVTRRNAVDVTRLSPLLSSLYRRCLDQNQALRDFSKAVISEVECIPYDDVVVLNHEVLHHRRGSKFVKPFGVVSLVWTNEKNWEEAIDPVSKFLEHKMDSSLEFTDYETLQTAIGAYQHMCRGQVLRAEDIWPTYSSGWPKRFFLSEIRVKFASDGEASWRDHRAVFDGFGKCNQDKIIYSKDLQFVSDRLRRMRLRCWSVSIADGMRSFDDEDDGYRRRIHWNMPSFWNRPSFWNWSS